MEEKKNEQPDVVCEVNSPLFRDGRDSSTLEKDRSVSFKEKWNDSSYRQKVIYSLFMSASFASLGMYLGQHGPTFLDIQTITDTDLEEASAFFTGGNAGHLAGCIVTGLIYSKVNSALLQFVVTFGMGVTNMAIPYCTQFELMVFIRFVSAAFGGSIANGLNTGHLALWGSEGNGLLQFSHFVFSVGGMLSPLFAEPFLLEKDNKDTVNIITGSSPNSNTSIVYSNTSGIVHSNTSIASLYPSTSTLSPNTSVLHPNPNVTAQPAPESRVKFVFFITGIFAVITAIPFFVIFIRGGKKKTGGAEGPTFTQRKIPNISIVILLIGLCIFELLYVCVEVTQFNFIMAFLVEEFELSKSYGAIVTALGWGSFAAGRFLMIFMTRKFTPLQLVIILSTLLTAAQFAITIFAHFGAVDAVIVFSAVSAFAMSGIFPAGLSWAEMEFFHVTGIFTSCVVVSSSVGNMLNPLFLGYLMEQRSNMWFCYLLLTESFIMCVTLLFLFLFSRFYVDKKFGSLASTSRLNMTKEVALESNGQFESSINDIQ